MLPWSLDDLTVSAGSQNPPLEPAPDFVEDRPQAGAFALLGRLEEDERDTLYEIVGDEIRGEIRSELHGAYGQELEVMAAALQPLAQRIESAVREELHQVAVGAVELALAMAERLARASIEADETYLVRCIEELVQRTQVGASLTVVAHPDEITRLQRCTEALRSLNVTDLIPDRSLALGGCIVRSGGQEWDVTLAGQAESLAEKVRASLGTCSGDETPETVS